MRAFMVVLALIILSSMALRAQRVEESLRPEVEKVFAREIPVQELTASHRYITQCVGISTTVTTAGVNGFSIRGGRATQTSIRGIEIDLDESLPAPRPAAGIRGPSSAEEAFEEHVGDTDDFEPVIDPEPENPSQPTEQPRIE